MLISGTHSQTRVAAAFPYRYMQVFPNGLSPRENLFWDAPGAKRLRCKVRSCSMGRWRNSELGATIILLLYIYTVQNLHKEYKRTLLATYLNINYYYSVYKLNLVSYLKLQFKINYN